MKISIWTSWTKSWTLVYQVLINIHDLSCTVFDEQFMNTNVWIYFTYVHIVIMYIVVLRSKEWIVHTRQHCAITIFELSRALCMNSHDDRYQVQ